MQHSTETRGNLCIGHGPPVAQVHGILLASSKFGKRQVDGYDKKAGDWSQSEKAKYYQEVVFLFSLKKH